MPGGTCPESPIKALNIALSEIVFQQLANLILPKELEDAVAHP